MLLLYVSFNPMATPTLLPFQYIVLEGMIQKEECMYGEVVQGWKDKRPILIGRCSIFHKNPVWEYSLYTAEIQSKALKSIKNVLFWNYFYLFICSLFNYAF
jgi:hypothetical protein